MTGLRAHTTDEMKHAAVPGAADDLGRRFFLLLFFLSSLLLIVRDITHRPGSWCCVSSLFTGSKLSERESTHWIWTCALVFCSCPRCGWDPCTLDARLTGAFPASPSFSSHLFWDYPRRYVVFICDKPGRAVRCRWVSLSIYIKRHIVRVIVTGATMRGCCAGERASMQSAPEVFGNLNPESTDWVPDTWMSLWEIFSKLLNLASRTLGTMPRVHCCRFEWKLLQ